MKQTEKQFQSAVVQYAKLHGWAIYHTFYSLHSQKGFPDLTLLRIEKGHRHRTRSGHPKPGRLIFAELKSENGRLTPDQERWLRLLGECPCEVYLWRPSNWDEIENVLK